MTLEADAPSARRSARSSSRPAWVDVTAALLAAGVAWKLGVRPSRYAMARRHVETEPHGRSPYAAEEGRGRSAETPSEVPARGWKDILWRTWEEVQRDRVLAVAAGVTFYGLLAIFPFLTAFVSLYGLVADPATVQDHLQTLSGVLPGAAMEIVGGQMQRLAENDDQALGAGFVIGLLIALWSANAGMKAVFDALNVAYDEDEKRGFVALNAVSFFFTLGAIAFILVAIAALVVVPVVLQWVGLGQQAELLIRLARWPILLLLVAVGIAMLYRYGPSRERARWRWITWGAALASVLFIIVSIGFGIYAANFTDYNETYGSLGAVIAFMTWIWLTSTVVLLGAELNAEIEHQTVRDTTTGRPRRRGQRGAVMADTVGPSKG